MAVHISKNWNFLENGCVWSGSGEHIEDDATLGCILFKKSLFLKVDSLARKRHKNATQGGKWNPDGIVTKNI